MSVTEVTANGTEIPLAELRRSGVVRVSGPFAEVLVVLADGNVKAYSGVCPHLGGPLVDGEIRGDRITCPWHRYEWSLTTGKCLTIPGKIWEGVAEYTRPRSTYSACLVALSVELTEHSVRVKYPSQRSGGEARPAATPADPQP